MDVKYRFNGFTVDPVRRLLFGADGQPITLKPRVVDTLLFLVEHRGELLEKQRLLDAVWPHVVVEENNLNQAISALRRVFGETRDDHRFIVTEAGRGYRFVAHVETIATVPAAHFDAPPAQASAQMQPAARSPRRGGVMLGSSLAAATVAAVATWIALQPSPGAEADPVLGQVVRTASVTTYAGNELAPSLSPDGSSVVFSRDDGGENRDLYVARIGGSASARLTDAPEPDRFPAWSPNGAEIAFLRQLGPQSFDVVVVPAVGGAERRITTVFLRPADIWGSPPLAWTPQSDGLVFTTRSGDGIDAAHHIYRLMLSTGDLTPLTSGENVYDTSPAISPDGQWLAFVRHPAFRTHMRGTLMVQPVANAGPGEPVVVPTTLADETSGDAVHSPSWSADGRHLAFVAGEEVLEWALGSAQARRVYVATGLFRNMTTAGDIAALTMVRDGTRARAVVSSIRRSWDIFALPLSPSTHEATGLAATHISSSATDFHARFSPDGRRIAFISSRDGRLDVWIAAADGSNPVRLTSIQSDLAGFPRWSPDGKQIAFHAAVGTERIVFAVDPIEGPPQRIGSGCCVDWSANAEHLYVMNVGEAHTLTRIRLADGEREPLFAGGFPTVTADGSRLLYGKMTEHAVYARAIAGDLRNNSEETLVTDAAYPAGIATTADGFFYLGHSPVGQSPPVRFYDYATRGSRTIARIPGGSVEILSVSPDGAQLLYASQAESSADLVLLEFGGPWGVASSTQARR